MTTIGTLLDIQTVHLAKWEKLLKPEVFKLLRQEVGNATKKYSKEEAETPVRPHDYYDVPRGLVIDEILANKVARML